MTAVRSSIAFVIEVRTFVSPGPGHTAATPSVPVSRENASAAKPALPSWRTSTRATSRSGHAWKMGSICTPWIAKIAVVPALRTASTSTCPPFGWYGSIAGS